MVLGVLRSMLHCVRPCLVHRRNESRTGPRIGIKVRSTFMPPATLWSLMHKEMHGLVESALVVPVSKDSACRNRHADHMLNFRLIGPSIHYRPSVKAHPYVRTHPDRGPSPAEPGSLHCSMSCAPLPIFARMSLSLR